MINFKRQKTIYCFNGDKNKPFYFNKNNNLHIDISIDPNDMIEKLIKPLFQISSVSQLYLLLLIMRFCRSSDAEDKVKCYQLVWSNEG